MFHQHIEFVGEQSDTQFLSRLNVGVPELQAHLQRRVEDGQFIRLFQPSDREIAEFVAGTASQLVIDQVISFRTGPSMSGGVLLQRRAGGIDVSSHT
jgi:hypothetical protein